MPAPQADQPEDSPFATALRTAIERRGLGLGRIAARLEEAGTPVSTATLSYWRSGRSRPGRQTSLTCLATLEKVLRVEPGSLVGQLGRPAPRGRNQAPPTWGALWSEVPQIAAAFDLVDQSDDDHLTRVSHHDTVHVGPDGTERGCRIQQVMRAERDGVDRFVVMHGLDDPAFPLPEIRPAVRCTVGRVVANQETGVITAEMLLLRPLRRGELVEVAYDLCPRPPYPPAERYERRRRFNNRQYVLEVRFHPDALPSRCERYVTPVDGSTTTEEISLDPADHSFLVVELDGRPGVVGARWEWPQNEPADVGSSASDGIPQAGPV
ncbi:XRE family transcriptional regulator [Ornithinimicrobium tianjinense]|uniref:Uncharacterized protein n=1 Tax=Ornithinimicrobium tianjinense TaxID=1195761 RepID=A0A917BSH7_9MICO|nr:XRE family transcriptional regulator [Ornithinimicrobium tianjinense]GGF54339.1 hypothetical protein GCM10011366_22760 [Ornithinimicrobium tianjinense]